MPTRLVRLRAMRSLIWLLRRGGGPGFGGRQGLRVVVFSEGSRGYETAGSCGVVARVRLWCRVVYVGAAAPELVVCFGGVGGLESWATTPSFVWFFGPVSLINRASV